jgi:DNA-binding Lrp family transcriptional regulator
LITENDAITIAELAKRIKVSVTTINNAMKPLRKNKIIDRTGARKNGTWIVNQ